MSGFDEVVRTADIADEDSFESLGSVEDKSLGKSRPTVCATGSGLNNPEAVCGKKNL